MLSDTSDHDLRALVREAVARRLGHDLEATAERVVGDPRAHASHALLPLVRGGDGDGACLIEPAVRCSHCGYCLSYGH